MYMIDHYMLRFIAMEMPDKVCDRTTTYPQNVVGIQHVVV